MKVFGQVFSQISFKVPEKEKLKKIGTLPQIPDILSEFFVKSSSLIREFTVLELTRINQKISKNANISV